MVKKSTRLGIAFFSLALAGIIFIQYCWIKSLQEDKLRDFRSRAISAIARTNEKIQPTAPWNKWSDTAIAALLRQSFSSVGLSDMRFEFSIDSGDNRLASHGFTQQMTTDSNNLILCYHLSPDDMPRGSLLTVVIPAWKKFVLKDMGWVFAMCGLLTIMVIVVFWCALILNRRRRQYCYDNRTDDIVRHLVQQLETPLSTMSVAVEALGNDKVMYNSEKRHFFQQAINEESKRMNEQVKKIFE